MSIPNDHPTDPPFMTKRRSVWELLKRFYLGEGRDGFDAVKTFNERPQRFDFNVVLRAAGISSV